MSLFLHNILLINDNNIKFVIIFENINSKYKNLQILLILIN